VKYKTVKKASEIVLAGVKVDLDVVDGSVKGLTLTDINGSVLRVSDRAYNMFIEIPAPPETETKFKLSGTVLNLPVEKLFDQEYDAECEKDRLSREVRSDDNCVLKVEKVEVPVAA